MIKIWGKQLKYGLPRLPLTIFLVAFFGSLILGFSIIYNIVATHSVGENLRLDNEFIKIDFPKNWIAYSWSERNASGNVYSVFLYSKNLSSIILFRIYDENATQHFMEKNNLKDALAVVNFETRRMYNEIRKKNENSSLIFEEAGGIKIWEVQANYSKIIIKNAVKSEGTFHDMFCLVISYIKNHRLVEIFFWREREDYEKLSVLFEKILNSTRIKV